MPLRQSFFTQTSAGTAATEIPELLQRPGRSRPRCHCRPTDPEHAALQCLTVRQDREESVGILLHESEFIAVGVGKGPLRQRFSIFLHFSKHWAPKVHMEASEQWNKWPFVGKRFWEPKEASQCSKTHFIWLHESALWSLSQDLSFL